MVKNNRLAPILSQYKELELGPGLVATPWRALGPAAEL
jgi:hypothetical protein